MTKTLSDVLALPCIGEGNFRRVYRDGDTVYKVEYGEGSDLECNRNEVANLYRLRAERLPANIGLPAAYVYNSDGVDIVAMQYIDGQAMGDCYCLPRESHGPDCLPEDIVRLLVDLGIDAAYGNVILSGRTYFIVDADADLR